MKYVSCESQRVRHRKVSFLCQKFESHIFKVKGRSRVYFSSFKKDQIKRTERFPVEGVYQASVLHALSAHLHCLTKAICEDLSS